jgi:hypothetical protein
MLQSNVIRFPAQVPPNERLRLYRDEPCTILSLAIFRVGAPQRKVSALGN